MNWFLLALVAASSYTVRVDQAPLRSSCDSASSVVAPLPAGTPVEIKFSLAGSPQTCYQVSAMVEGKQLQGYLAADAMSNTEEFEKQRRDAAPVMSGTAPAPRKIELPKGIGLNIGGGLQQEVTRAMELIQRNQPGEAQRILEDLAKRFPKDPGLWAAAGMAAYRNDQPQDAVYFFRQSLDLKRDPTVERMMIEVQRQADADKSGEKKHGMRFLLRYDGTVADSETASAMLQILEEEFSRVSVQLGCRAEERIVTIVQTREAYVRTTQAAEWSGAAYDGKIHVPLMTKNQIGPQMREIVAHEIVHACLANMGNYPLWLHEGLAQKLSGRVLGSAERNQLMAMGKKGGLPKLGQLGQSWNGLDSQQAALAYGMSLLAVDLFYQHHSGFGMRNLLNNPDQLPRFTESLDKHIAGQQ